MTNQTSASSSHPIPSATTPQPPSLAPPSPQHQQLHVNELQAAEGANAGRGSQSVPEDSHSAGQSDTSLDDGRLPPHALGEYAAFRVYLPDEEGMRLEQPSGLVGGTRVGRNGREAPITSAASIAAAERSLQQVVAAATVSAEEKIEMLFTFMRPYLNALKENEETKEKLQQARTHSHQLLTQLNEAWLERDVAKLERDDAKENAEQLEREVASRDDIITSKEAIIQQLQHQLQQTQNLNNQRHHQRSSIRCDRFRTSRVPRLGYKCTNCKKFFSSEDEAHNAPACRYHLKEACELPNKMVAEMFPENTRKRGYWPCCKIISAQEPPPCMRGSHILKAV